jgi:hypothetical protein
MKRAFTVFMLALSIFVTGCASTKETERLLSAAGFRMVPAETPAQQAHLKQLPHARLTKVVREGKLYFVFPDAKKNVIYVGQQAQFDQYQELRLEQKLAQQRMSAAQMNSEAAFAPWGAWSSVGFVEPVPVYRR